MSETHRWTVCSTAITMHWLELSLGHPVFVSRDRTAQLRLERLSQVHCGALENFSAEKIDSSSPTQPPPQPTLSPSSQSRQQLPPPTWVVQSEVRKIKRSTKQMLPLSTSRRENLCQRVSIEPSRAATIEQSLLPSTSSAATEGQQQQQRQNRYKPLKQQSDTSKHSNSNSNNPQTTIRQSMLCNWKKRPMQSQQRRPKPLHYDEQLYRNQQHEQLYQHQRGRMYKCCTARSDAMPRHKTVGSAPIERPALAQFHLTKSCNWKTSAAVANLRTTLERKVTV